MAGQTDRQTDKPRGRPASREDRSNKWGFTAYEGQWSLFNEMPQLVAEWGWQEEICPDTGNQHYQGYIRLKTQVRFKQMSEMFPGIHLLVPEIWERWVNYCKKKESAVPGTQVHQLNQDTSKALTMNGMLMKLAHYALLRYEPIPFDKLGDADYEKKYKHSLYWGAIALLTEDFPEDIGLATNSQIEKIFREMYQIYMARVPEETPAETDRQTDIPVGVAAFEE